MEDIDKIILIIKSDSDLAHQLCKGQGITLDDVVNRVLEVNPELIHDWCWEHLYSVLSIIINGENDSEDSILYTDNLPSLSTYCMNMI